MSLTMSDRGPVLANHSFTREQLRAGAAVCGPEQRLRVFGFFIGSTFVGFMRLAGKTKSAESPSAEGTYR